MLDDPVFGAVAAERDEKDAAQILNRLARRVTLTAAFVAPVVLLLVARNVLDTGWSLGNVIHVFAAVIGIVVALLRKRLQATALAVITGLLCLLLFVTDLFYFGVQTPGVLWGAVGTMIFSIGLGRRHGLTYGVATFAILLAFGFFSLLTTHASVEQVLADKAGVQTFFTAAIVGFIIVLVCADLVSRLVAELNEAVNARHSERRQRWIAEKGRDDLSKQLADLLDAAPVGVIMFDEKGDIIAWNQHNTHYLGLSAEEMLGRSMRDYLISVDPVHPLLKHFDGLYSSHEYRNFLLKLPTYDGVATLLVSGSPIYDAAGRVAGAIQVAFDVTVLTSGGLFSEQSSNDEAEKIAALAQNLRSPLMAVGLSAESLDILLDAANPSIEKVRAKLALLVEQQRNALEVVEQVHRITTAPDVVIGHYEAVGLATSAATVVANRMLDNDIEFTVEANDGIGTFVSAQPILVRQILISLMVRAREAVLQRRLDSKKWVSLKLSCDGGDVIFTVSDNSADKLPNNPDDIFDRHFQGRSMQGGTDTGLYISQATAQQVGGRLTAAQSEDGLQLALHLPIATQAPQPS